MEYYKRHLAVSSLVCTAENLEEIKNFCKYFARTDVAVSIDSENITITVTKNSDIRIVDKVAIGSRIMFYNRRVGKATIAAQVASNVGFHEISKNKYYEIEPENVSLSKFDDFSSVQYFAFSKPTKSITYNGSNKSEIESEFNLDVTEAIFRGTTFLIIEGWRAVSGDKVCMEPGGYAYVIDASFNAIHFEQITKSEYEEFVIKQKEHLAHQQ